VSVTASVDSYFGSRAASPELGFLYNNYMQTFDLASGETFSLAPRAMPYSSMSTSIVSKDGQPMMVVGSPGSARIISAVTQVISHWVDVNGGIEAAVAAPRVHVVVDRKDDRDNAYVEQIPEGLDVEALGFDLTVPQTDLMLNGLNAYFGGVHAIALEEGGWRGAADPRRDGAVGYAK
jgi:gamma-glutamyltranspeptidase/glutathione hydrolase